MPQLKTEVEQRGWQWVDWNVCAEDAVGGHPSADTIYRLSLIHIFYGSKCYGDLRQQGL